jgi:uncharacterized protein involved in exopolysaccharide biosynthesis
MLRFLDCFYRHRRLLLAILVIPLVLSIGFVTTRHRAYEAVARVWVDASIQGSQPNPFITAADAGDKILGELLQTRAFCARVAARSGLVPGPTGGSGAADQTRGNLAYQALSTHVLLSAAGPNVIAVSFQHGDPRMAARTAQAVVDLFEEEVLSEQANSAQATVSFYQKQVSSARNDLARADTALSDYLSNNPDAAAAPSSGASAQPGSAPDVTLMALQRDDDALRKQADDLTQKLNDAQLALTVVQQSTPNGFRLIDPPQVPQTPVSRSKPLIAAGVGGLVAGVLLSLGVLIALTAADTSLRYASEVEPALGLRLVGTIPEVV